MNRDEGMTLKQAQSLAESLVDLLAASCIRIAVAGSVRRQKPSPNDIEIVTVPLFRHTILLPPEITMFETPKVEPRVKTDNVLDLRCDELLALGTLEKRPDINEHYCWGTGVKRMVFFRGKDYAPVDLFQVIEPAQWGVIFAIRTGPGDFNHYLVTNQWIGGSCPKNRKVAGGRVWDLSLCSEKDQNTIARTPAPKFIQLVEKGLIAATPIETPEEEDFFREMAIPCWMPESRTIAGLQEFLRQKRREK